MAEFSIYEELMPKILLLVSPPDAVNRDKANANPHPYLKRRGKRRNHDYCDACNEKGNVICCTICPASFHSNCLDPPIDVSEIPDEWCCRACKYTPDRRTIRQSDSRLSPRTDYGHEVDKQSKQINESSESNTCATIRKRAKVDTTAKELCVDRVGINVEIYDENDSLTDVSNDIKKAFTKIIKESRKKNPKQFALPNEFLVGINLNIAGAEKDAESTPTDFDTNDLLKIPARKCYYCNGICLSGPMISCDFCPSNFHLNCLTPPLCSIPETKWMCPLHPHHILDKVMKNSDSITELSLWWEKLSQMTDPEIIKSQFTEKVRLLKPKKHEPTTRSTIQIPDIVKYHYKHPPERIPHLETLLDSALGCVWRGDFTLIPHYLIDKSNKCCNKSHDSTDAASENNSKLIEITNEDDNEITDRVRRLLRQVSSDELSTWDKENNRFKFDSCGIYDYNLSAGLNSEDFSQREALISNENGMSPWQIIEHIVTLDVQRNFSAGSYSLDETLQKLLVKEKIHRIMADLPPVLMPNSIPYVFSCNTSLHHSSNGRLSQMPTNYVKAVLCPLSHRAPLVYLYGNVLSIGKKFDNDVCLSNYGNCNLVSDEHAVIFYDEMAKVYELMNYSDFGTLVDGIHYTCNISANSSVKVVLESNMIKTSSSNTRRIQKSFSKSNTKNVENTEREKKTRSSVTAAETRSQCKKLLQKIDTIARKTHEVTSIAEEDLNEIARNVKLASSGNACASVQESSSNTEMPRPRKRGRPPLNAQRKCDRPMQNLKEKLVTNEDHETVQVQKEMRKRKKTKKGTVKKVVDSEVPRRSNRRVERSIFATYRRDKRKVRDCEKENTMISGESRTTNFSNENNSDPKPTRDDQDERDGVFYWTADNREVNCRCAINRIKFPVGRDDSWEISAQLHHGSYIRFGCIEFIFAVVNYPCPPEDRIYHNLKSAEVNKTSAFAADHCVNNQDDLSFKLRSLLNVLSSKMSSDSSPEPSNSSSTRSSSCSDISVLVPDHPDGIRLEI